MKPKHAERLMWLMYLLALGLGYTTGMFRQSLALVTLGIWYSNFAGGQQCPGEESYQHISVRFLYLRGHRSRPWFSVASGKPTGSVVCHDCGSHLYHSASSRYI